MKKFLLLLSFTCVSLSTTFSQLVSNSDVSITYVNPSLLKACGVTDDLVLNIENVSGSSLDPNSTFSIQLPQGISIVSINSTTYSLNNVDALNNIYTYLNPNVHADASVESLILTLQADCDVYELLDNTGGNSLDVTNNLTFDYNITGVPTSLSGTTLSYNIAQVNLKTTVSAFNLTLTVPNDYSPFVQEVRYDVVGNSTADQFDIYFNLPTGLSFNQLDEVTINGSAYTMGLPAVVLVSGTTYKATLIATNFNLSSFGTGDVVLVDYNFTPECLSSVQIEYWTGIDCFGSSCEFDNDFGFVNMLQLTPDYSFSVSNNADADYCGNNSLITYTITNNDNVGYTLYNPYIFSVLGNSNSWTNFKVNGNAVVTGLPTSTTGNIFFYLQGMETGTGPVLTDWNNDGLFGEIAPGETYVISYELVLNGDNLEDCPAEFTGSQLNTRLSFKETACTYTAPWVHSPYSHINYSNFNYSPPSINLPNGLVDGQSQTIELCIDRFVYESTSGDLIPILLDDDLLYGLTAILPCGVSMVSPTSAIWEDANGNQTTVSVSSTAMGLGTTVDFQSAVGQIPIVNNHIEGCLILNTTFNCGTCDEQAQIYFEGIGQFDDCPTEQVWSCESLEICTGCSSGFNCSVEGVILNDATSAHRTSFGWTDNTMTTQLTQTDVDNAAPGTYNVIGAYACDVIKVVENAEICGGADDFTPYIVYAKPSGVSTALLDLISAQVYVDGVPNAVNIVNETDNGANWIIEFTTLNGPFVDGTTLSLEANLSVSKPTVSDASFPYVFESEITSAFFTQTQWLNGAPTDAPSTMTFLDALSSPCNYEGQEFYFYKIEEVVTQYAPTFRCGETDEELFFRVGYQGGQSGDDFPNEFRPFSQFQGVLTFELTNPLTVGEVFAVSATVGGGVANVSQVGNQIQLTPATGVWAVSDKNVFQNYYYINIDLQVNCELAEAITMEANAVEWTNFIYANDLACHEQGSIVNPFNIGFTSPNIDFTFLNPIQNATTANVGFGVNITNNSNSPSDYPWMLVTFDPALVSISAAVGTAVPWSANQVLIQVGSLGGNATINESIVVSPLVCNIEQVTSITVESGYNCSGYPQNPGSFDSNSYCPVQTDFLELTLLKSNLNVDLLTSFDVNNPVNNCDGDFSIILQVYNDEKADITDLVLQFAEIPGLTLNNTSYYYPIPQGGSYDPNAFSWTQVSPGVFSPIPGANSAVLNAGFGFHNEGLDSDASVHGILANDGLSLYNFYHIKLDFSVDCLFDSNTLLEFEISGVNNCDEPIVLNASTYIDFEAPNTDLIPSIEFTANACDNTTSDDIFVGVYNSSLVSHTDLTVELWCDVDDNGVFDPNVDVYLSSSVITSTGGNVIASGHTEYVSFNSDLIGACPGGNYIATVSDGDGCFCNYEHSFGSLQCCYCSVTNPTNNITVDLTAVIPQNGGTDMMQYQITGYPLNIKNLTLNPLDPSLYVWDMNSYEWIYIDQFNPPCLHDAFAGQNNEIVLMQYNTANTALPHNVNTKLIYPSVNSSGVLCEFPDCQSNTGSKFGCPLCVGIAVDDNDCSTVSYNQFDDENLGNVLYDNINLTIFPNPIGSKFKILASFTISKVEIFDSSGRLVHSVKLIHKNEAEINCSSLSSANYIIRITDSKGFEHHRKIIK